MSSITVRNLDDKLKASLRLRAARHGLSMEQEVRNILQHSLETEPEEASGLSFGQRVNQRFKGLAADELTLPARQPARAAPHFEKS
jgi:plasmid stability protein